MAYFDDSMVQYFQPGDVDELVNCIYTLYSDQILRESMVANSSKFTQTYNWQNISENYVSLVKRVGAGD